jgi:5-(carboxyamino)imidazole ribonucleotide synthase
MENILGDEVAEWQGLAEQHGGLHIYGKRFARPGRKMGHITRLSRLGSRKS